MAKQLRVHQLAKELGVNSKAIIAKCQAEDVAGITNHMSVVSAGLAASIREWFSEGEHGTTIETADPVDLKKVRRRKRKADEPATGVAVAAGEQEGHAEQAHEQPPAPAPETTGTAVQEIEAPAEPAEAAPQEVPTVADVQAQAVEAPVAAEPEAPTLETQTPPQTAQATPPFAETPAPAAAQATAPETETLPQPAAEQAPQPAPAMAAEAPTAPAKPAKHAKPAKPAAPAPPPRPQMVAPAPAQIQGPRVIRVERPEPVRQFRPAGPRPPFRGPGAPQAGPPMPETVPDATGKRPKGRRMTADEEAEERRKKAAIKAKSKKGGGRETEQVVEHLREWRDRDLLERQERLAGAAGRGLHARRATEARRPAGQPAAPAQKTKAQIQEPVVLKDLCSAIGRPFNAVFQNLMSKGMMVRINDTIDSETAQLVSMELGVELEVLPRLTAAQQLAQEFQQIERKNMVRRNPVVTFMGHVDHGKTSLLDRIRNARVAEGEAGGITQHIGAYRLERGGRAVTFLDTPGHAAFTALRARGANMTDIAVLVVAADDGVMPQTIEALNHAQAAKVPIVVALNKIDLPGVDINRIYGQLAERGLLPSEWGGDTDVIKTSAVTGEGVDELVEHLHTLGEVLDLRADPTIPATGAVIETAMQEGTGPVASVLVQDGTLRIGDVVVCGTAFGRVRAMIDDLGRRLEEAGPSVPVQLVGLDELPQPGEKFYVVESLQRAKEVSEERRQQVRAEQIAASAKPVGLEALLQQQQSGELPELNVIAKADVVGSVEALRKTLGEIPSDKARLRILHAAVGGITESDVLLADASKAVIVGFNVTIDPAAQRLAEQKNVTIRLYRIIYDLTDALRKSLQGLLEPEKRLEVRGRIEVREVFKVTRVGTVAGCYVTDGMVHRNMKIRVTRGGIVIRDETAIESLRRFKDDVREVRQGMECGIKLANFDDVKVGDILEPYEIVMVQRLL